MDTSKSGTDSLDAAAATDGGADAAPAPRHSPALHAGDVPAGSVSHAGEESGGGSSSDTGDHAGEELDFDVALNADADMVLAARVEGAGRQLAGGSVASNVVGSSAVSVAFTTDADSDSDRASDLESADSGRDDGAPPGNLAAGAGAAAAPGVPAKAMLNVDTPRRGPRSTDSGFTRFVPRAGQNVRKVDSGAAGTRLVLALNENEQLCFVGSVRLRTLAGAVRLLGYTLAAAGAAPSRVVCVQAPAWDTAMVIQTTWPGFRPAPCGPALRDSLPASGVVASLLSSSPSAVAVVELQQASEQAEAWLAQYNLAPSAAEASLNQLASVPGMHLLLEADGATVDSGSDGPMAAGAGAEAGAGAPAGAGGGARDGASGILTGNADARRAAKRKARSAAGGSYTCLRRALAISKRWDNVAAAIVSSHAEHAASAGVATAVVCGAKVRPLTPPPRVRCCLPC